MDFNTSLIKRIEKSNRLIFLDNKIYTLHLPVKKQVKDFLCFFGVKYPIEESEEISELEKGLVYTPNRNYIENKIKSRIINKYVNKVEGEQKEINQLNSSLRTSWVEDFIANEVFKAFKNVGDVQLYSSDGDKTIGKNDNFKALLKKGDITLEEFLEYVENGYHRNYKGILSKILDKRMYLLDKCFDITSILDESYSRGSLPEEYIFINGEYFGIEKSSLDLERSFLNELDHVIEDVADKRGRDYLDFLRSLTSQKRVLEERLERLKKRQEGRLSWSKSKNKYNLKLNISNFILKNKDEEMFLFTNVAVDLILQEDNDKIIIEEAPRAKKEFNHPFIFEEGNLCYGPDLSERFKRNGISFPFQIPFSNYTNKIYFNKVINILIEAEKVIKYGYHGNSVPIKKLCKENFSEEFMEYNTGDVEVIYSNKC